jgi:DNA primase
VAIRSVSDSINFFESVFGKGRISSNGINFDVRCPICASADPTKKKLSIRTDTTANHCWVCGWKSRTVIPLIRKFGTQNQLAEFKELFGLFDNSFQLVTGEKEEKQKLELPKDFRLLTLANSMDPDVKAAWRYVYSRGLTDRDAWYFKLGVSDEPRWKRRIIMPSFDAQGNLNFFVARAIDKDKKPKYDSPDVDKNPIVFNDLNIDWSKRLVLVEGSFDLVKCPENSTAILGSDLDERHEIFNKILLHNTPIALSLDGDMWDKKTPKIAKKLQEYNIDVIVVDVRPWGDPGSMSKIEFEEALKEAKPMSWDDNFSRKLKKATAVSFAF